MKHFKIYLEARTLVLKNLLQNWVNTNCDCCCIIYCCCCAFFNYICKYCCRCCINCCCKLSCMVSFLFSVAFSRDSNVLANFPCVFSIQEFLVLFFFCFFIICRVCFKGVDLVRSHLWLNRFHSLVLSSFSCAYLSAIYIYLSPIFNSLDINHWRC